MSATSDGKQILQQVTAISFNHDSSMFAMAVVSNSHVKPTCVSKISGHFNYSSEVLLFHSDPLVLAYKFNPGFVVRSVALLDKTNFVALVPVQKYQDVEDSKSELYEFMPSCRRRKEDQEKCFLYK